MYHTQRANTLFVQVFVCLLALSSSLQAQLASEFPPTPDDLFQAEQLVNQCLGTTLAVDSNRASRSGNRMSAGFLPHENGVGLERFYVATYLQPDADGPWRLREVQQHGLLSPDTGAPDVHLAGVIDPAKAHLLITSVSDVWRTALGPDFQVLSVSSSQRPDHDCELNSPIRQADGVFHEVIVMGGKNPDREVLSPFLFRSVPIIQEISGDFGPSDKGEFKFNFREDVSGYPEFISVECVSRPVSCGETLKTLHAAIGITQPQRDPERERQAILAVLPATYSAAHIGELQYTTGRGRENITVNLEPLELSPNRESRGFTHCYRVLGSTDDWTCEYRFIGYRQNLAGDQQIMVRDEALTEEQVNSMIAQVEDDIVNAFSISINKMDGVYNLRAISPGGPRVTARFDGKLNLTATTYQ